VARPRRRRIRRAPCGTARQAAGQGKRRHRGSRDAVRRKGPSPCPRGPRPRRRYSHGIRARSHDSAARFQPHPFRLDAGRLRAIGAIAARISAVDPGPSVALPVRSGPIEDFPWERLRHEHGASAILLQAETAIASTKPEDTRTGLTHGDLWYGNTLWDDNGDLTAVLDWDAAGIGSSGIDLGSLRLDAALCYGPDTAAEVLAGWQDEADRPAPDVPYWDAVAALATPPDMAWVAPTIADQGRPDLTGNLLTQRRDAFLRTALTGLDAR